MDPQQLLVGRPHGGCAVLFHSSLKISIASVQTNSCRMFACVVNNRVSWHRASSRDILAYKEMLIVCLEVDKYYDDIVRAMRSSAEVTIPVCKKRGKAGWSTHVKQFQEDAIFWNRIWVENGRLTTGSLSNIRRSTRAQYRRASRWVVRNQDKLSADRMAQALASNNSRDLWGEVKKKANKVRDKPIIVDDADGELEVCEMFKVKYESLYSSVSFNENDMNEFIDQGPQGWNNLSVKGGSSEYWIAVIDGYLKFGYGLIINKNIKYTSQQPFLQIDFVRIESDTSSANPGEVVGHLCPEIERVECRASVSPREDVIFALSDDYLWIQFSFGSIFKVLLDVSTELEDGTVDLIEVAIHADGFDMIEGGQQTVVNESANEIWLALKAGQLAVGIGGPNQGTMFMSQATDIKRITDNGHPRKFIDGRQDTYWVALIDERVQFGHGDAIEENLLFTSYAIGVTMIGLVNIDYSGSDIVISGMTCPDNSHQFCASLRRVRACM
ncbi:hypothetical protein CAPTEDRAFT_210868 [Capitella teleta]|uniref:Uncharacterized protein n=1 Tax=Capitella teleta TaxID=283909 RepID=R7U6T5_CAPTE|nr:hypothetical protein CAPTEDRAFT_210868 [Capitella teleta]|eukprot:ELT98825.1 hypothetical protein CAPTEDRAFT_210868 [Capitella teleta]